ncbi:uncharacterized protein VTP21DRAFT_9361 [Calcarisporiella thermophila]|uniref:uncharacterized protein n=1 Tax=Calcarisporiella thermophila TaxID=911321 RepID=UPI0037423A38
MSDSTAITVGLVATPETIDDLDGFIDYAQENGYDFASVPISRPEYKRVLFDTSPISGISQSERLLQEEWRTGKPFSPEDLVIKTVDHSNFLFGHVADWLQLDSKDANVKINSELVLKKEIAWASHIGLSAVLFSLPLSPKESFSNFARCVNLMIRMLPYGQIYVHLPISTQSKDGESSNDNLSWNRWSVLRNLCEHNPKLSIALEFTADLPEDTKIIDRWFAEPVKAIVLPTDIFITNARGYPVLSKWHQTIIRRFLKLNPNILISGKSQHPAGGIASYHQYIRYLQRSMPELGELEKFAVGYQDYLQAPLQPLMDNLESSTYEVFEKDPVKYAQYEKAVYHALLDRVPANSDKTTVIMVVGAGRGPLVTRSLRAADAARRKVRVYAVEKNPNAAVTLQNKKREWGDRVTIVFSDMRRWNAPEQADILVSELLGSFGDNELSPECLDGAQKLLKPDGISIPKNYTAYIAPLSSCKLHCEVAALKENGGYETPYVVMFQSISLVDDPQAVWQFDHPNAELITEENGAPLNNYHNTRHSINRFKATEARTIHGLAGYFESVLYGNVNLSIHPHTHSPGMFSWFPIFFPLKVPIHVPQGATIETNFWRCTDSRKVWYEWSVRIFMESEDGVEGEEKEELLAITHIHNTGGRSNWIGL